VCDYQGCGKRFKLKEYLEVHHQRTHFKEEATEPVATNMSEAPAVPEVPGANDHSEIVYVNFLFHSRLFCFLLLKISPLCCVCPIFRCREKLRERLVRMGLRHHDQLAFHQQREQELLDALREVADTLDQSLRIIDRVTGGDPNVIPQSMQNVALRYSTKPSVKHSLAAQMQTANGAGSYAYSQYAAYAPSPPRMTSYNTDFKTSLMSSSYVSAQNFSLPPSF
jgi:hypothetical protein